MKVFIVDGSSIIREHLIEALSGFEKYKIIGEAQEAVQAVESIRRLKPDVVILSIRISGGSGIEMLQTVKKYEKPPVIIMFSRYPEYRRKCMDEGADYFFDNSTESIEMIEVLNELAGDFPD